MSNTEILAHPDVVAALQVWWDETLSFARGTSSGVIADMLEDAGWTDTPDGAWAPTFAWMRLPATPGAVLDHEHPGPFHQAAGVWPVSSGSTANPILRQMLNVLANQHQALAQKLEPGTGFSYHDFHRDFVVLIAPEDAWLLGTSRELRDYFMVANAHILRGIAAEDNPNRIYGLPPRIYGLPFRVNDVQPVGHVDVWYQDRVVTARVY